MTDGSVNKEVRVDSITTSLLKGIKKGDEQAWGRLVDVYMPLVYRWCRQQGLQDADVLDVGQNVLQRLSTSVNRFQNSRPEDSFRGWLRQVTRNAIIDHYRRQEKQAVGQGGSTAKQLLDQVPGEGGDDTDSSQADEAEFLYCRLVNLIRSEFSEQDWQAFYRTTVENQPPADVAIALGISRNQVYLAKSRIRKRLRDEFERPD